MIGENGEIGTKAHKTWGLPMIASSAASPQHCWNFARGVPRLEARILQARVPDVWQAKETRPCSLDPRVARGQRSHPQHRLRLQPRPHRDLRHIQEQRKARIVNYTKIHPSIQSSSYYFRSKNKNKPVKRWMPRPVACWPAWWSKIIWLLLLNLKEFLPLGVNVLHQFNLQCKLTDPFQIVWMFSDIDEMTGGKIRQTLQILWLYKFSLNSIYRIRPWTKSAKLKIVFFPLKQNRYLL